MAREPNMLGDCEESSDIYWREQEKDRKYHPLPSPRPPPTTFKVITLVFHMTDQPNNNSLSILYKILKKIRYVRNNDESDLLFRMIKWKLHCQERWDFVYFWYPAVN